MTVDRDRPRRWAWPAGVAVAAVALFATTFDPRVDGGDAPESVAGVHSVGILHAPGYPAYVLAARVFSWIVPFGSLAARVNLFSVVCAVGAVLVVYAIGRQLGAPPGAAALGALSLASATAFWFYAGFAKFYPLTSLLLAGAIWCVLRWGGGGSTWLLAVAGASLGLATGASYQVVALAVPGIVVGALLYRRGVLRPGVAALLPAVAVSAALWAFVLVRAGQDPAVNWGAADTPERLVDLISMRDFGWGAASFSSVAGREARVSLTELGGLPDQIGRYAVVLTREFSIALVVLALIGAWWARRRIPLPATVLLAGVFVVNILGALFAVGVGRPDGFDAGLIYGGFLLAASLVVAVWIGLGAWAAQERIAATLTSSAARGSRKEREARRESAVGRARWVGAALAALLLLGPVLAHHGPARHDGGVALAFAEDSLRAVPEDGILMVAGADAAFPFQYAQIVREVRPDVDVVDAISAVAPWYCDQLKDRLEMRSEACGQTLAREIIEDSGRPVYVDSALTRLVGQDYAVQPVGIVSRIVDGEPGIRTVDPRVHGALIESFDLEPLSGLADDWPHQRIAGAYVRALLDQVAPLAEDQRYPEVQRWLEAAAAIDPDNELVRRNLLALARRS